MTRDEYYANLSNASFYLQHHGVKGQQWRERNGPPYPLDEKGQEKLAKQIKKALHTSRDEAEKTIDETGITEGAKSYVIKDLKNNIKDYEEIKQKSTNFINEFDANRNYYSALAGTILADELGMDTMGEVSLSIKDYVYDDRDQGAPNSFSLYLNDTNRISEAKKIVSDSNEVSKEYYKSIDNYVNDILGKYGDININKAYTPNVKTTTSIYLKFDKNKDILGFDNEEYRIQDALENASLTKGFMGSLSSAKDFISKSDDTSNKSNGWMYLNQAVENLGYSDIPYKMITDSMWNEINAEVRRLNK